MWRQFYSTMEQPWLPMFGMGVFITAFVVVLVHTYAIARRADFDRRAALPLNDEHHQAEGPQS